MKEQPEALRLADALGNLEATGHCSDSVSLTDRSEAIADAAAAELRRLHEVETLYRAAMRGRHAMSDEVLKLTAQRDALLEVLRFIAGHDLRGADLIVAGHIAHSFIGKARVAIKAVEGEKT